MPQMVNSLTKLGMAQGGSNLENRSLAIDLCGVMVLWEERRMKELQAVPEEVHSPLQSIDVADRPLSLSSAASVLPQLYNQLTSAVKATD